jgi:hypothetical protein
MIPLTVCPGYIHRIWSHTLPLHSHINLYHKCLCIVKYPKCSIGLCGYAKIIFQKLISTVSTGDVWNVMGLKTLHTWNSLDQAHSTFYVVWATLAKFSLHAHNMKFNTHNEEWTRIHIIIHIILPVYVSVHHVQLQYTNNNRKTVFKMQFTT